jgi:hypothetical protein
VSALTTTTQKWGVLTGNPYAPLADEPEEEGTPIQRRRQQKGPEHGRGWSVREEEPGAREAPDRKGDSGHQPEDYVQTGSTLRRRKRKGWSSDGLVHD